MVVLGPGSWFTSVLPHLLLPELARALVETAGRVVVVLNLVPQPGETDGFSPAEHLRVLRRYCPQLRVDVVIADQNRALDAVDQARPPADEPAGPEVDDWVRVELAREAAQLGAELVLGDLCEPGRDDRHHPAALAAAVISALARLDDRAGLREPEPVDDRPVFRESAPREQVMTAHPSGSRGQQWR